MSELSYSLRYLSQDGNIAQSDMLSSTYAKIQLKNGKIIYIFIANDRYLITAADIQEAASYDPKPQFIVRNAWQTETTVSKEECAALGITLIHYQGFRKYIEKLAQE